MKRQDFYYELPDELIAQYPLPNRTDSKLLCYEKAKQSLNHHQFKSIVDLLKPGDVLVLNNSKVVPARLFGKKETGGQVEFLMERKIDDSRFWSHIKSSKAPKVGSKINLGSDIVVEVIGRDDDLFECQVNAHLDDVMDELGHIPLPPYIQRSDEKLDHARYQTVFAYQRGSVAAPTAGLHFDEAILAMLQDKGVHVGYTTLHVGAGTFRPMRCDDIQNHKMHSEWFSISEELVDTVNLAKKESRRVIAVGTTAMRSLESAAQHGQLKSYHGDTDIFIYPGYDFQICDGLITNFHLPESTLLMLVAAFIGYDAMKHLYQEAILHKYRFFSYGDACFLIDSLD